VKRALKRILAGTLAVLIAASTLTNVTGLYAEGEDPLSRIQDALLEDGEIPMTAEDYAKQAEEEIDAQNYDAALADLESARSLTDPGDSTTLSEMWLQSAAIYFVRGEYGSSRDCTDKALFCSPNSPQAYLLHAQLCLEEGNSSDAVSALEKYVSMEPADSSTKAYLAQLYEEAERYDDAAALYEQLSGEEPEEDAHRINALRCAFITGDYEKAQSGFDAYLADETKADSQYRGVAAFISGAGAMQLGQYESAVTKFREAADAGYETALCYEQMTACAFEAGEYETVAAIADEIEQNGWQMTDEASFRQYVGFSLLQLERFEEAVEAFTKSVEADASLPESRYYRGVALMMLERCSEAAEDFTASIAQGYRTQYSYYNRGVCRIGTGNYKSAQSDFTAAAKGSDEELTLAAGDVLRQITQYLESRQTKEQTQELQKE
jgi:tetratricopeptide (TPR) repeat protein